METVWAVQHLPERPEDAYMLEKKDNGLCNTTSDDIWSRDMVTHEISERETSSDSEKHETEEKAGSLWTHVAQDRRAWRQLWRPPASSGVNRLR